MRRLIIILIMLVLVHFPLTGKTVPLQDLEKPNLIAVNGNRIYIADGATVSIYSLTDFTLIRKFGKEGDGPQEFKRRITFVDAQTDELFLISTGKVSYFTRDGLFKKDFRTLSPEMRVKPLGDGFAGGRMVSENGTLYISIGIYDANLKKIKELHKQKFEVQLGGKGTKIFAHILPFHVSVDFLFIAKGDDFVIDVLDKAGNKQYTITYDYKPLKVTNADKDRTMDFLKTNPETGPYLEMLKPIIFPDYFPAIQNYYVVDGKVYVFTYKRDEGKSEYFIFDAKGKFLKQSIIPYAFMSPVDEYPAAIKNGILYQLIENEETEAWDLHINPI
jgi:hypothetical protein